MEPLLLERGRGSICLQGLKVVVQRTYRAGILPALSVPVVSARGGRRFALPGIRFVGHAYSLLYVSPPAANHATLSFPTPPSPSPPQKCENPRSVFQRRGFSSGRGRIRTCVGIKPTGLQPVPFGRSGTRPSVGFLSYQTPPPLPMPPRRGSFTKSHLPPTQPASIWPSSALTINMPHEPPQQPTEEQP